MDVEPTKILESNRTKLRAFMGTSGYLASNSSSDFESSFFPRAACVN